MVFNPKLLEGLRQISQAITFLTKNNEEIEAACKKLETNKILCTTKKYSAILSDLTT